MKPLILVSVSLFCLLVLQHIRPHWQCLRDEGDELQTMSISPLGTGWEICSPPGFTWGSRATQCLGCFTKHTKSRAGAEGAQEDR